MRIFRNTILFAIVLFVIACKPKQKDTAKIIMQFKNLPSKQQVYVTNSSIIDPKLVDSLEVKSSKKYRFTIPLKETGFYDVYVNDSLEYNLVLSPEDKVKIEADLENIGTTKKILNSPQSVFADSLSSKLAILKMELERLDSAYNMLPESATAEQDSLTDLLVKRIKEYKKLAIKQIINYGSNMAIIKLLYQELEPGNYVFGQSRDLQFFMVASDSLLKYYPNNSQVKFFANNTFKLIQRYHRERLMQQTHSSYVKLPDIRLPGVNGDTLSLLEIKQPITLLSFWGTWEEKCIANNIALNALYKKYSDDGLEIYAVAFDKSFELWKRFIRIDELHWKHVIDTSMENSVVARLYNIQELPYNYVIDNEKDSILAKNLTPEQLDDLLSQQLNN